MRQIFITAASVLFLSKISIAAISAADFFERYDFNIADGDFVEYQSNNETIINTPFNGLNLSSVMELINFDSIGSSGVGAGLGAHVDFENTGYMPDEGTDLFIRSMQLVAMQKLGIEITNIQFDTPDQRIASVTRTSSGLILPGSTVPDPPLDIDWGDDWITIEYDSSANPIASTFLDSGVNFFDTFEVTFTTDPVPEPSTSIMLCLAGSFTALRRKR